MKRIWAEEGGVCLRISEEENGSRVVEIWGVVDGKETCLARATILAYRCVDVVAAFSN